MQIRTHLAAFLAILAAINLSADAADSSYKEWRNSMKAAEQAKFARDFHKMREILEGSAPEARKHGPVSSAWNSLWLAIAYSRLGMSGEAIDTFNKELERIGPEPKALKVQVLRGLLLNDRSMLEFEMKEYDKAMSTALEARGILESAAGKYHPVLFNVYQTIGTVHALQQNIPEAEKALKTALKLAQVITPGGFDDIDFVDNAAAPHRIIRGATTLGGFYHSLGKLEEAEEAYETALKSAQAAYPKDSVMRLLPLRNLAKVELKRGRTQDFNKHVEQTYDVVSKTQGLQPINVRPLWLKTQFEADQGNAKGVVDALKKLEKVFEVQSYDFADLPGEALALAVENGILNSKRAETLEKGLKDLAEAYRANDAGKSGVIYVELGKFAETQGKADLAASMFEDALKSQHNAKDKALLIGLLGKMAEGKVAAGKKTEALPLYRQVSVTMREKYGNDMRVADAMDVEAALMKDLGDEEGANRLKAEAMSVRKKALGQ
jgi:tetratricopeptide (TPR) repeat protein